MRHYEVMPHTSPVERVQVLGGVCAIRSDGSQVELASASQRRLLALLALHAPRPLRGEWLADALGVSPGALRTSISRVRTAIGTDVLRTAGSGYTLTAEVDATVFTRAVARAPTGGPDRLASLERALSVWTGPAVDEFAGETWAEGEVARVTETHAGTVDELADGLISAGRSAEAVALLEAQIGQHPYRDRSRGLLIRALAAGGRQGDALRAFQHYRSMLVDELGIEPSTEVVRIERRVATGWDGTDGVPGPTSGDGRETPGAGGGFTVPWPTDLPSTDLFVGRRDELALLRDELARATTEGLGSVLVTGEPGIGKSTLLSAFAREVHASEAAVVLYGRSDETPVPLQPLRTVLATIVEHAPTELLAGHVARCGGELQRICPRLAVRVPTAPVPTASDEATEQYLALEAAADLLGRVAARQPVVLLLDDLQWAKQTALVLLRRLVRALAGAPVLLVATVRESGAAPSEELRLALAELGQGHLRRLPLGGLRPTDLAELVARASPAGAGSQASEVANVLHQDTAGHPLYASQLLRHWLESGKVGPDLDPARVTGRDLDEIPPNLREVVTLRVEALGLDVARVLGTASVLGLEFAEEVLVEVESLPEATVLDALDAATQAGLLEATPSVRRCHRFTHALVAHALTASLGGSRRARLHGRTARALEKLEDRPSADTVVALARHCMLAGWPAEAQRWSVEAGDLALADLAPAQAASHYGDALDLAAELGRPEAERADLLVRLGEAQHQAGDACALATLEQGAQLARRTGAHKTLARAALAADRGFVRLDQQATELLALVRAALEVADGEDRATSARLLALLAQCLVYTPDSDGRVAAARDALALAEAVGDTTLRAQIGPGVQWGLTEPGKESVRARVAQETIAAAEATGDPRLLFSAHHSAYNVAVETADPVAAARSLARIRAMAQAVDEPRLRWIVGLYDIFEATMAGRLEEAEAMSSTTYELGIEIGAPDAATFFAGQLYVIGTFAGRHAELFPLVEQAARDSPDVLAFGLAHAICCAVVGRTDVARAVLRDGADRGFGAVPADNLWTTSVLGYAVLAIELADVRAAAELLPLIEPFSARVAFNGVTSQGPIAAYVGKLSSLLGLHDQAERHLHDALATADAFGWTYHRATTLFALAQARHRALGHLDEESYGWLAEAADVCETHGFRGWTAQIESLGSV